VAEPDIVMSARRPGAASRSLHRRLAYWICAMGGRAAPLGGRAAGPEEPDDSQRRFWSHVRDVRLGPVTLDLGGQVRLRYEHDDGFSLKGYEPGGSDDLLLERVRLELTARFSKRSRFFVQLQDAHAFLTRLGASDFPRSSPIEDTLDLRQLYLEWLQLGGSPIGLRLGRQQIAYGDQRVFGPGNWGNTGRFAGHGAMLTLETAALGADLWVGQPLQYRSDRWPNGQLPDFLTFVTYVHLNHLPFRLDLFYALKFDGSGSVAGEAGEGDLLSHTLGLQLEGTALGWLDYSGTFIGQLGSQAGDTIRAFGANARLGVTIPLPLRPRLAAQLTWGSGDEDPRDGVHNTFDGVFGGRDIFFYGYLNLFFWANLRDYEADLHLEPVRGLRLFVEYHYFTLDRPRDAWYSTGLKAQRQDPAGLSGLELGHELDLRAVYTLLGHRELMAGYGRFFPGTFVRATGSAAAASWVFGQAAYSF
jgi:hypothetical protein